MISKQDYKKYIVADSREVATREQLLRVAIESAKKRDGRLSGYRSLRKRQLYQIVKKQNSQEV